MPGPVMLIIRDGWGINPGGKDKREENGDATLLAHTPFHDELYRRYPGSKLSASGPDVGLPEGQMGNSEVGHLNLGAGRIVYQDLTRINKAIADGELARNDLIDLRIAKVFFGGEPSRPRSGSKDTMRVAAPQFERFGGGEFFAGENPRAMDENVVFPRKLQAAPLTKAAAWSSPAAVTARSMKSSTASPPTKTATGCPSPFSLVEPQTFSLKNSTCPGTFPALPKSSSAVPSRKLRSA